MAERVGKILDVRDASQARPLSHMTLTVDNADGGTDLAGGDVGYEVVAVLDLTTVDANNDVLGLYSSLGRTAVRRNLADDDAALR